MQSIRKYAFSTSFFSTIVSLFLASSVAYGQQTCDKLLGGGGHPPAGTNSAKFVQLEKDSPERTKWVKSQNRKTNENLKTSPNFKPISAWLRILLDKPHYEKTVELNSATKIQLVYQGPGKADELILSWGNNKKILLSSFDWKLNGSIHFTDFSVSPDNRFLAMTFVRNGSSDKYEVVLYDLLAQTPFWMEMGSVPATSKKTYWLNGNVYFRDGLNFYHVDTKHPSEPIRKSDWEIIDQGKDVLLIKKKDFYLATNSQLFLLPTRGEHQAIVGEDEGFIYLQVKTNIDTTEIRKIPRPYSLETIVGKSVAYLPDTVVRSVTLSAGKLYIKHSMGTRQTLTILDTNGTELANIDAPEGTSFVDATSLPDGRLSVRLTSSVIEKMNFIYDLKSRRFEMAEDMISARMLTVGDKVFESFFDEITSADGTRVPIRITKLKSVKQDGKNPVLMNVYGGFEVLAYFYPSYDNMILDFISKGGIVVDPAIRGGNELGEEWSLEAVRHNKVKTLEDLIATSRFLVARKYTTPRKVILRGASNGGMVVAAAALKSPDDFGLVVALSGVQDLVGKDTFAGRKRTKWAGQFGDSQNPADYPFLAAISPVEQAAQAKGGPQFLIVTGRDDTRVDPGHSYKLTAALQEQGPDNTSMISIKNAGHTNTSVKYQGLIAWHSNVVIWTTIYDLLGWQR